MLVEAWINVDMKYNLSGSEWIDLVAASARGNYKAATY